MSDLSTTIHISTLISTTSDYGMKHYSRSLVRDGAKDWRDSWSKKGQSTELTPVVSLLR